MAENALRQFARWLVTDARITVVADISRNDIEDYKVWLAAQHRAAGQLIAEEHATATAADDPDLLRAAHRMGLARRPAPEPDPRTVTSHHEPEPLPKFLNDRDAATLMAAARAHR